jgi:hypothetical protein
MLNGFSMAFPLVKVLLLFCKPHSSPRRSDGQAVDAEGCKGDQIESICSHLHGTSDE